MSDSLIKSFKANVSIVCNIKMPVYTLVQNQVNLTSLLMKMKRRLTAMYVF